MMKYLVTFLLLPFLSLVAAEGQRFEALCPVLDLYERPIKVLTLGPNSRSVAFQIAEHYDATCVVASRQRLSEEKKHANLIHLRKELKTEDLIDLNKREHFDVIVAMHSLRTQENWQDFEFELFKLGDNLIFEALPKDAPEVSENPEVFRIAQHLTHMALGESIGPINESHFIWLCFKPKSVRKDIYSEERQAGITLTTFYKHAGSFPTKASIRAERKELPIWKRYFKRLIHLSGNHLD